MSLLDMPWVGWAAWIALALCCVGSWLPRRRSRAV